jgi:hypothetical protein
LGGSSGSGSIYDSIRICKTCGIEKPITDFRKSSECIGGYRYKCKKCINDKNRKYPKPSLTQQICKKCNVFKDFNQFETCKGCRTGFRNRCKECRRKSYIKKGYSTPNPTRYVKGYIPHTFIDGESEKIYRKLIDTKYRRVKKMVLERDNCKCQICGSNEKLQVHHRKTLREAPGLSHSMDNLITLCIKCHFKLHRR